jgi:hypothetical protein
MYRLQYVYVLLKETSQKIVIYADTGSGHEIQSVVDWKLMYLVGYIISCYSTNIKPLDFQQVILALKKFFVPTLSLEQ